MKQRNIVSLKVIQTLYCHWMNYDNANLQNLFAILGYFIFWKFLATCCGVFFRVRVQGLGSMNVILQRTLWYEFPKYNQHIIIFVVLTIQCWQNKRMLKQVRTWKCVWISFRWWSIDYFTDWVALTHLNLFQQLLQALFLCIWLEYITIFGNQSLPTHQCKQCISHQTHHCFGFWFLVGHCEPPLPRALSCTSFS